MNCWNKIKNLFKKKKPSTTTKPEPIPIPPMITTEDDFFNVSQLFDIMKYDNHNDTYKANRDVFDGCIKYCDALNTMFKQYKINTYYRVCHCLAQIAKESSHLRHCRELGSNWYFWKRGLNPKWRGRGLIQLTHKYHYVAYTKYLKNRGSPVDLVKYPEKLAELPYAADAIGFYWTVCRDLNPICDKGDEAIREITLEVNGGLRGLANRTALYLKAKEVLKWQTENI